MKNIIKSQIIPSTISTIAAATYQRYVPAHQFVNHLIQISPVLSLLGLVRNNRYGEAFAQAFDMAAQPNYEIDNLLGRNFAQEL